MKQLPLIGERRAHVAIMKKSWGLTAKILGGEKTIESRWYMQKTAPWNMIDTGDAIYFKDSGCPVTLKARVECVLQFEDLTPEKVQTIIMQYGRQDGLDVNDFEKWHSLFKDKRYCLLIFLTAVEKIDPFEIEKKGFGSMSAWITVSDIEKIRRAKTTKFRQPSLLRKK
jgi:ASC-1-like (ASCH) protein